MRLFDTLHGLELQLQHLYFKGTATKKDKDTHQKVSLTHDRLSKNTNKPNAFQCDYISMILLSKVIAV